MRELHGAGRKRKMNFSRGRISKELSSAIAKLLTCFHWDRDLWNIKGLALSELERYDETIKCYDAALEHYPRDIRIWNNKCVDLDNAGEHIEAIRCFDIAIDIDPQDADAWCHKGVSFGLLKWFEEALECFEGYRTLPH